MKTVYFVRHAKSSWADVTLDDRDRPLNKRGKRDAPYMAEMMAKDGESADLIISSPAKRAKGTARYFRKALKLPKESLIIDRRLYHAGIETILGVVQELPTDVHAVYVFGHNPGFTHVANHFSTRTIDNVPTTGILKVVSDSDKWLDFDPNHAQIQAFYYPKMFNLL